MNDATGTTTPGRNIANTRTNVSVLFIDKSNTEGEVMLVDASKMGTKVKDGKNQKTVFFMLEPGGVSLPLKL